MSFSLDRTIEEIGLRAGVRRVRVHPPALLSAAKPADAIRRGFNLLFDVLKGAAL